MTRTYRDSKSAESNRRSDQIRQRRASQSRTGIKKSANRKSGLGVHNAPPVMARTVRGSTQPRGKAIKKPRRRFDVTLNAQQGAERRLPALPQVRVDWRVASFLLVVVLGLGFYQLWNSPSYRVDAAQVEGLVRLTSADLNDEMGITGDLVFSLNRDCLRQQVLREFPEVKTADVHVALPNTVAITVTERIPLLAWQQGDQFLYVDEEGLAFPQREGAAQSSVPVVNASDSPPAVFVPGATNEDKDDLRMLQLCGFLSKDGEPEPYGATSLLTVDLVDAILFVASKAPEGVTLIYDPGHGLGWKDVQGWDVYLGNVNDMDMKLRVYDAILQQLRENGTKPVLISVEFVHAPYFRLAQTGE